jgi:prefoldin subunit 5
MAFNAEIGNYAGETDAYPNAISKFLANGVQWIITMVEKTNPDMLPLFASLQTLNDTTRTLSLATNSKIIDIVRRNGNASTGEELKCSPINAAFRSNAKNTDSIYYASKDSPVYYIDNAVLNVLPIPDNNEIVKISIVLPDTSVAGTDSAIDNFPSEMYHGVVLYAAAQLLHHKMAALNAKLPTDLDADTTAFDMIDDLNTSLSMGDVTVPAAFSDTNVGDVPTLNISTSHNAEYLDALASAKNLIDIGITTDEAAGTNDDAVVFSAGYWLKDEDEEMVQSTLTVAAQELQRASSYLSKFQADINKEVQEFTVDMQTYQAKVAEESAKSSIDTTRFQAELSFQTSRAQETLGEFNANIQKKISLYTTIISKLNTDYQWLQSQYQVVKAELSEFMAPYTQAGILDSTAEGVRR